jgi:chemotaxis protein CheZ
VQRKVFRIEAMLGKPRGNQAAAPKTPRLEPPDSRAYANQLEALRDMISRSERELATLRSEVPIPRMQKELGAAITAMDDATQKILRSTEAIDESARALSSTLKDDYNRGLAQEILEQAVHVYEACNFQDLAGQRINKAIAALRAVEQEIDRLCDIWGGVRQMPAPHRLINGPKLDGDSGHADQSDIDRIFATGG